MLNKIIEVQNMAVNINNNDYICISDFEKFKEGKSKLEKMILDSLNMEIK